MTPKSRSLVQVSLRHVLTAALLAGGPAAVGAMEVTDAGIAREVEEELLFEQSVDMNRIDLDVTGGTVELNGTVSSLLGRRRAERLAATVKGVTAVDNDLIVVPRTARSDRAIAQDVRDALLVDPATDSYELDVHVDNGIVTLEGHVDSWHEKSLSERVASGVRGVQGIVDRMELDLTQDRPDSEIRAEIDQKLKYDVLVDHEPLEVQVEEGKVTLSGHTTTLAERTRAISDAWTQGVEEVDASQVTVLFEPVVATVAFVPASDEAIEDAIEDAAFFDPRVSSAEIEAEVSDGVATLRGIVDNLKARRAAAELARTTAGVERVKDRIKVRPAVMPEDENLEMGIGNALRRNPITEAFEIDVIANDGRITLTGTVDSYAERAEAEDVASGIYGVTAIRNLLSVSGPDYPFTYQPYGYPYSPYVHRWESYVPSETYLSDAHLLEEIEDELWWSPYVDADQVNVAVLDGVATLTGTVDSIREMQAAEHNALEGGAVMVRNHLDIRTSGSSD